MQGFKHLIILAIALWCLQVVSARSLWVPVVRNVETTPSGPVYSTWRISNDSTYTFFAAQEGVFEYDGVRWNRYLLPGKSDARGVKVSADRQRVYVGGEGEFGYLRTGENGLASYVSLSDSLSASVRASLGNVFDFYEFGGVVYVRSDFMIVVVNGDNMRVVRSPDKMFASVLHDGTLYVATDKGIRMLSGNRLIDAPGCRSLAGKHVNAMLAYGNDVLIVTSTSGLFRYDGSVVRRVETPFGGIMNEDIVSCAATDGKRVALGTVSSGLLLMDIDGRSAVFNVENGLHSNMVQSVDFDWKGNLWIGHDFGLDFISLNHPFSMLYDSRGSHGMGNTSVVHDGRLYFGTNRGLYSLPWSADGVSEENPKRIGNLVGSSWWLCPYGDDLLLMHGKGIYLVKGDKVEKITDIEGAWMCHPLPHRPGRLLVSTYHGAYVIARDKAGVWRDAGRIEGLGSPGRYFEINGDTVKVFLHRQDSAALYRLSAGLTSAEFLCKVPAVRPVADDVLVAGAAGEWNVQNPPYVLDSVRSIIPFNRGFMLFDKSKLPLLDNGVRIERVADADTDSVLYSANFSYLAPAITLAGPGAAVDIEWDSPESAPGFRFTYSYRLNGGEWSPPSETRRKRYAGLQAGDYYFEVKSLCGGNVISDASVRFSVITPWYSSRWFFAALILIVIGALYLVFGRMKGRIRMLRREKHTEELRHKNMEVANLTLNMARKNEILISLKERILHVAREVPEGDVKALRRNLLILNSLIDSNIDDDDILHRFEEQFDVAHDNFITRLGERHPSLNRKERLLCAYSKMDLSTKEIASLMNLTVRGVESLRYRVRKKIGLDSDTSLTAYLNGMTS